MSKLRIPLNDMAFYGDKCSSRYQESKYIEWDRMGNVGPVVFFTDSCLDLVKLPRYKQSKKIAWLIEPTVIFPQSYNYIVANHDKFDLVISHNRDFLSTLPNGEFCPNLMCWIPIKDWGDHLKSIDISIIVSAKNLTPNHSLRHRVINVFKDKLSVYGYGYKSIDMKLEVCGPSRFQVCIENCDDNDYFSEKFLDLCATKTVPIFKGTKNIGKYFNDKGFLRFDNLNELNVIINKIKENPEKLYNDMLPYVEENFLKLKEFGPTMEDRIYDIILKKGYIK